ncbi:Glycerol uptake facilitator [Candidatus Hepatincolaceae symbiont of Richtersius coronifer]
MYSNKAKYLAEFIGTCVLILFGCGVVAMVVLFATPDSNALVNGGFTNVVLGWGFAVMLGIYVSGTISGAHLNPAVTLGMAITKRLPWNNVAPYIIAQLAGAFFGAMIVFIVYYSKWVQFDPMFVKTAGVFATFPAVNDFYSGLIDQVVGTFLLVFIILAITDPESANNPKYLTPLFIGLLIMAIGASFGGMHGYAVNPARDFGPRLFALVAGFKNTGFENSIWIVPIVGPIIGGILGALIYDNTIGKMLRSKAYK